MMTIKQRQRLFEFGDQGAMRYVHHANGVVPCVSGKEAFDRARTCWRRNPHTGRLEMHWQANDVARARRSAEQRPQVGPISAKLSCVYRNLERRYDACSSD
ncbi:MAG TPA: hypothetical protein VGD63_08445 [Steroidobacteraceae bacterium]